MLVEPSVWQVGAKQWMVVEMAMVEEFVDGTIPEEHQGLSRSTVGFGRNDTGMLSGWRPSSITELGVPKG